jgi:hypothetical protein
MGVTIYSEYKPKNHVRLYEDDNDEIIELPGQVVNSFKV